MIPASALDFLSGLAAAVGINMLTSTSGTTAESRRLTAVDAAIWVVTAAFVSYCARIVEKAERNAALVIDNTLTPQEVTVIRRDEMARVRPRFLFFIGLGGVSLCAAVLFIPGLVI